MTALEIEGSTVKIPVNEWASLPLKERLDVKDKYKEVVLEDPEHHFPWNEPGRRYQAPEIQPGKLSPEERRIFNEAKGISTRPPHIVSIIHEIADHIPHPH